MKVPSPIVAFTSLVITISCTAQAPPSLYGNSFGIGVTGGAQPFANTGYFLFLPGAAVNSYEVVGIYNVNNTSGTYSYSASGARGTAAFNDSNIGALTATFVFNDSTSGSYQATIPGLTSYQLGNFEMFASTVPSFVTGRTFTCNVQDGLYPFASAGSFTITTAALGNS